VLQHLAINESSFDSIITNNILCVLSLEIEGYGGREITLHFIAPEINSCCQNWIINIARHGKELTPDKKNHCITD